MRMTKTSAVLRLKESLQKFQVGIPIDISTLELLRVLSAMNSCECLCHPHSVSLFLDRPHSSICMCAAPEGSP
jgi:hypothetical protein